VLIGCLWQPKLPSHFPLVPQVDAAWTAHRARGSGLSAATGVHLPGVDASAQLRHAPAHALSQQTPSTQKPDRHSCPLPQTCPSRLGPHVPLTHAIPSSHSSSFLHAVVQAPSAQRNGWQFWIPGAPHTPRPLHVPGVLRLFPEQVAIVQGVSRGNLLQPPRPSHSPVWPQDMAPALRQMPFGSAVPSLTGQQVPSRLFSAHDTHGPSQATLQQTPSAQKPLTQSSFCWHLAPFMRRPQLFPSHCRPLTHCALDVQCS
jgi:hypothetical protein